MALRNLISLLSESRRQPKWLKFTAVAESPTHANAEKPFAHKESACQVNSSQVLTRQCCISKGVSSVCSSPAYQFEKSISCFAANCHPELKALSTEKSISIDLESDAEVKMRYITGPKYPHASLGVRTDRILQESKPPDGLSTIWPSPAAKRTIVHYNFV